MPTKRSSIIILLFMLCVFSNALAQYTLTTTFYGVRDKPLKNIQNRMNFLQSSLQEPITPVKLNTFISHAPEDIKEALKPYGYFQAKVATKISRTDSTWLATFYITPGIPVYVTQINVQMIGFGKDDPVLKKYLKNFSIQVGDQLNTDAYDKAKNALYNLAQLNGYLMSKFVTHIIAVDLTNHTAKINLIFDTGHQYYFGDVYFNPTPFQPTFLQRFVPFNKATPYNTDSLLKLQNNLSGTVYFKNVFVTPMIDKPQDYMIPIHVQLIPKKPKQWSYGVGYGTDTGVRGTLGWEWRRVTSTGHYFQTLMQVTQRIAQGSTAQARYVIPGKNPATDSYVISAGVLANQISSFKYIVQQFGISQIKNAYGWQRILTLSYQHENSRGSSTNTLLPSIAWQRIQADNVINTTNGYRVYLILQPGLQQTIKQSFLQTEFQGKYIKSFSRASRVLLRTDLGYTFIKNPSALPLGQSFAAGGSQSIRGYGYQDFGPGSILINGSIEYQHRLYKKFYGAIFFDTGNAFNHFPVTMKSGAGIGILYRSPIGPLELTFARALNIHSSVFFRQYQIQFTMGPDL